MRLAVQTEEGCGVDQPLVATELWLAAIRLTDAVVLVQKATLSGSRSESSSSKSSSMKPTPGVRYRAATGVQHGRGDRMATHPTRRPHQTWVETSCMIIVSRPKYYADLR